MDMQLADASALYSELLTKLSHFQVHEVTAGAFVICVCEWCGKDLLADYDMIRLHELVRLAFTHLCVSTVSAGELEVLKAVHESLERR